MTNLSGLGRSAVHGALRAALGALPLVACVGSRVAEVPAHSATTAPVQVASAEREAPVTDASPARVPAPSAAASQAPEPAAPARVLPTECEAGSEPCSAPAPFVEAVCHGKYPELALAMFSKGTPWRRGYLKVEKLEPVNVYDGERSDDWLVFGEEVLILRTRGMGAASGVQVSGPTDVDILRWDGTCATIRQEMLAPYPTNTTIATARIAWKYLDEPIQAALLANKAVEYASSKERPACRGSTMKHPDAACDKASRKLTDIVTVALRGGLATLPTPERIPAWKR